MVRFKLAKSTARVGGLTWRERRELRKMERHAEHDRKRRQHDLELVEKARKMREEHGGVTKEHKPHSSGRLLLLLLIIAALVYLYLKYWRS